MATPGRRADPPLEQELFEEPYRFDFFQAVRLLERLAPGRAPVGRGLIQRACQLRCSAPAKKTAPRSESMNKNTDQGPSPGDTPSTLPALVLTPRRSALLAGGLLLARATLRWQFRTRGDCVTCGRGAAAA